MEDTGKRPTRAKSRQSLAHIPSRSQQELSDRQNATADLSTLSRNMDLQASKLKRKVRGKSLGPGGLEALQETTGNAIKNAVLFQPKSILMPTVPLTPPKHIPSFDELRKRNTDKGKSPLRTSSDDLLIDFSTPAPSKEVMLNVLSVTTAPASDPFSPAKEIVNHENAPPENETEEARRWQAEKTAILERRAARRKSMANRRVSFAPEATLHTWSVMEVQEDSTTSSAANSTRRQSSMTAASSPSSRQAQNTVDCPSTPPKEADETLVEASPVAQRELHQKKGRRRSSALPVELDESVDEMYSSSPSGDVTTESSPVRVEDSIESDSDSDGDTAMSLDDITTHTENSNDSNTQTSLDERLRQAANQAGTRGIDYDENGDDLSMEIADGTVTNAFQPWVQTKQQNVGVSVDGQDSIGATANSRGFEESENNTEGITMEMTLAVGGIVSSTPKSHRSSRKSIGNRRRSVAAGRWSSGDELSYGDETMEFTTVAGGILADVETSEMQQSKGDSDEDVSMDITTAVGGVQALRNQRLSGMSLTSEDNETMDMTAAVGGILDPIEEQTEPQTDLEDDQTAAMDMTRAAGHIVTRQNFREGREQSNLASQKDVTGLSLSMIDDNTNTPPGVPRQFTSVASETGSPSLALKPRLSARSKTGTSSRSRTPVQTVSKIAAQAQSLDNLGTPEKQITPVPVRAATPERTPLSASVVHRGASPKKLFQAEIRARVSPTAGLKSPQANRDPLFATNSETGHHTPKFVLHAPKPHQHLRRRSSGVGIDKEGFGSPRVTELLGRRPSIGDAAADFKLKPVQSSRIRFEDPKTIEREIDSERADEQRRESGRFVMEQEANGHEENATLQLRDMIEAMSPKKSKTTKLKGRKSLAIGSAKGLLGKRPAELDDGEDDSESSPKRLRAISRENSPVKKIHLPKPPSKEETTGRLTKAQQLALDIQQGQQTPKNIRTEHPKNSVSSPRNVGRFKDVPDHVERPESFEEKLDNVIGAIDPATIGTAPQKSIAEEKISLQQFLNMTNIHFIELSTTKRRPTMPQSTSAKPFEDPSIQLNTTEASFVAASTTLPLLELYQHATRELKSYISTGRKIIRSIEAETLAEQPLLFREYVEAQPDIKLVMDNQFRNGKTNARLQSKEGWYTWRSQLVDGLQGGLNNIKSDLNSDAAVLQIQKASVEGVLPTLANENQRLTETLCFVQARLAEIENIDHEDLKSKRLALQTADKDYAEKLELFKTLQAEMQEKQDVLSQALELKTEMEDQIHEANRVREEYRGWSAKDVLLHKVKLQALEGATGWSLLGVEIEDDEASEFGVALSLGFRDSLRLFFHPAAFQPTITEGHRSSGRIAESSSTLVAPVSLIYANQPDDATKKQIPTETRFFIQIMQSQLQDLSMMPRGSVSPKMLLDTVSNGWEFCCKIAEEIRLLGIFGLTRVSILNDETLAIKIMLLEPKRGRVDVEFILGVAVAANGTFTSSNAVRASVIHGSITKLLDQSKIKKIQTALSKEIENNILGDGAFVAAIQGFEQWYHAQVHVQSSTQVRPQQTQLPKPTTNVTPAPGSNQLPNSSTPPSTHKQAVKRSPLAAKKPSAIQKKHLPLPSARLVQKVTQEGNGEKKQGKDKENISHEDLLHGEVNKPAITPEMQEAMMQHTPIKRVGALRRSPIGGNDY